MELTSYILILLLCLRPILGITNDKTIRDSYISAYMDTQGTHEAPVGVVYPEPSRPYGPPQPKPMYGPPVIPSGGPLEIPGPTFSLMDILSQLPEKLEFLPKVITALLGLTKIILKITVLKIILKFVFIFCLYFFLPKMEMLDMMTSMTGMEMSEPTTVKTPVNATTPATAAAPETEDQDEMRLNKMANFVMDSIEAQKFLQEFCNSDKSHYKCNVLKKILKMDTTMSIPKIFASLWIPHRNKISEKIN